MQKISGDIILGIIKEKLKSCHKNAQENRLLSEK
jgi:hypothetical protein